MPAFFSLSEGLREAVLGTAVAGISEFLLESAVSVSHMGQLCWELCLLWALWGHPGGCGCTSQLLCSGSPVPTAFPTGFCARGVWV